MKNLDALEKIQNIIIKNSELDQAKGLTSTIVEFQLLREDLEVLNVLKKYFYHDEGFDTYEISRSFWNPDIKWDKTWEKHKKEFEMIDAWMKRD